jgi:uncharacterized membrane protein YraQ (UPF0718 family)
MLLIIWATTLSALLFSYRKDQRRTLLSLNNSLRTLRNLAPGLLAMVAFVGLTLAVVPEDQLARLFTTKGVWGFVLVSLMGAIVTIPGPIAFPLAGELLNIGAEPAVLASFITTLTMVGLATSSLEISHFGRRFTVMRQSFSFVAAIAIGLILGVFL